MNKMYKTKKIFIDFDGVINDYKGWKGEDNLFLPKKGILKFLEWLSQTSEITIFTTRDTLKVSQWLEKHNLRQYIADITNVKRPAHIYIDDRGLKFNGNFNLLKTQIEGYKVYWET